MNFIQFGLFIIYAFSLLVVGLRVYWLIAPAQETPLNYYVHLGELLLLGSIVLVGEMLLLSLIGFYKSPFLWGAVAANLSFLMLKSIRLHLIYLIQRLRYAGIAGFCFILLTSTMVFRNCYFLIDVDSLSTYLYAQKMWLEKGSSLVGGVGTDFRAFLPHFDGVPYALGLSVFPQETLFPELVTVLWRVIVLLLVFGYTLYRFNAFYAFAALAFVLFNDHFFYSGANQWVIINAALIAFIFASALNFLESRRRGRTLHLVMALIFLSQFISNKYQMLFATGLMCVIGGFVQPQKMRSIVEIVKSKRWVFSILIAWGVMSLWLVKNLLTTGDPVYPILAGNLEVLGWTKEKWSVLHAIAGGIDIDLVFKYFNYLFIWPGVAAAKYVAVILSIVPFIFLVGFLRSNIPKESIIELCFWLSLAASLVIGISLFCHQDPRYYRYPIAIMSFTTILCIDFIFRYCLLLDRAGIISCVLLIVSCMGGSNEGIKVVWDQGGAFLRPTIVDNINVILNKMHTDDAIKKHHPEIPSIRREVAENKDRANRAAWDIGGRGGSFPAFLLPIRPAVSLWHTNLIQWNSYQNEDSIVLDLEQRSIESIMRINDDGVLRFLPLREYAKEAVAYDRKPKNFLYTYNFPYELEVARY